MPPSSKNSPNSNSNPRSNPYAEEALSLHRRLGGKLEVVSKYPLKNRDDLSLVYTPGVAAVSSRLAAHPAETADFTIKGNSVAVVSDGSAVLGLGDIGPAGALPVMEGKAVLFKHFAGIDAFPVVLSVKEPVAIIKAVEAIAPTFGGINLEDIAAPKCFDIEKTLREKLDIPVVHDDQWGTAVVVLAGLINALKVVGKEMTRVKIVISGAGAAGTAVAQILHTSGAARIIAVDSKGVIFKGREANNQAKENLADITNPEGIQGDLAQALVGADVFIGVSAPNLVSPAMMKSMARDAIVFAMANPIPEIMPDEALAAGAAIVATGRSDYPNQVNNALSFPGVFRGALDHGVRTITTPMLVKAAENLAALVSQPTREEIIPSIFAEGVVAAVASAIRPS
jgi:malate dehydrogenase (oxaloacetate-decarboxylating)